MKRLLSYDPQPKRCQVRPFPASNMILSFFFFSSVDFPTFFYRRDLLSFPPGKVFISRSACPVVHCKLGFSPGKDISSLLTLFIDNPSREDFLPPLTFPDSLLGIITVPLRTPPLFPHVQAFLFYYISFSQWSTPGRQTGADVLRRDHPLHVLGFRKSNGFPRHSSGGEKKSPSELFSYPSNTFFSPFEEG